MCLFYVKQTKDITPADYKECYWYIGQIDPLRAKIIVAWIDEATNWQTEFVYLYRDLLVHSAPRVLTLAAAAFEIETYS